MRAERQTDDQDIVVGNPAVETATNFLRALFDESDTFLFRPIETWVEDGKKRSRVIYKSVMYSPADPTHIRSVVKRQFDLAVKEYANVFFGVCPRHGGDGRFDLAWQIRTVRALWCDIDNVRVAEALERADKAGLPQPSIVVNSGNGVHVYWLLGEPYLIDDVGVPPPVLTEWVEGKNGKRRPRKYIEGAGSGERLYLDIRANVPELSPKAIHVQDINAGVAAAVGGDHTHDLSRILRVPGTLNRKDERNGRAPVPCELVTCDMSLNYAFAAFAAFAKFADRSPQKTQRRAIATVQLPLAKKWTPTRRDKLNELVTACAAAPVGTRSEADWRLVCTAIEKGWPKTEVWAAVSGVGKFADGGEAYFERTWSKAEDQTREQLFLRARGEHDQSCVDPSDTGGDDEETGDPGLVVTIARLILDEEHFAQDEGGKLYRYHGGVYQSRGEAVVANLSLHRLESDKFACARLYGKLANICPDLPSEHLAGTSVFKAITGGDSIVGEYKFRDSFDFIPFARLVFSANSPPQAHDSSEGFFDRWLVVPFDRRFRGAGEEIPADKLDAMLSEPAEQSGLLNRALGALPRLRATGRFMSADSVSDAFSEFHAATDPLTVWLDGETLEAPRLVTPKKALIAAFNQHCEQSGKSPITGRQFGLALKRLRPDITDAQRTVAGKLQWCYLGIGIKCDASHGLVGNADSPDPAEPRDSSLDSRDSRDKPSINLSHARGSKEPDSVFACAVEQDRDYRVNRVNPVNGECVHEFVEEVVGDRIKTSCRMCGKFQGYRPYGGKRGRGGLQ